MAFSAEYRLYLEALFAAVIAVQLQYFADDPAARLAVHMDNEIDGLANFRFNEPLAKFSEARDLCGGES